MRNKRINKILGTILAITLPLTIFGVIATVLMTPVEFKFDQRSPLDWLEFVDRKGMHMGNGNMWGMHNNNNNNNNSGMHQNNGSLDGKYTGISQIRITDIVSHVEVLPSDNGETWVNYEGTRDIRLSQRGSTLSIYDKDSGSFKWNTSKNPDTKTITIYVGDTNVFLDINMGVGNLKVSDLTLSDLDIDGGVGDVELNNIVVKDEIDIDGGVGNLSMNQMTTRSMEIDMGVGNMSFTHLNADIVDIDGGAGNIDFKDSKINTLKTDQGLGKINLNNTEVKNQSKH